MTLRSIRTLLLLYCLCLPLREAGALEVNAFATNGGTFDLTTFSNWVHFTATASNASMADATLSNGIPTVALTSGSAFSNFTDTYTNGASQDGEISDPNNPYVVDVQYSAGPSSNDRHWFGGWASTESVSFNLTVPTASGYMDLYTGGFNGTAANGGATLSASFASGPPENDSSTFLDTNGGGGDPYWGAVFSVYWTGRTVGDVMTLQFTNVPAGAAGNAGVVAVVVPEPSACVLAGIASLLIAYLTKSRYKCELTV